MNEAETRVEHIDPAVKTAGRGIVEASKVLRECPMTLGRLNDRVGASLMTAVGLDRLVAGDPEQYVATASRLAADVDDLSALRRALRDRTAASPLCDGPGLARRVEAACLEMCKGHRRSAGA